MPAGGPAGTIASIRHCRGQVAVERTVVGGPRPSRRARHLSGDIGNKYPNGWAFTREGFPDFSPYAVTKVDMPDLTGNRRIDAALANQHAGLMSTPQVYSWHHVEDTETMLLVPRDLHETVRHTGGAAILREQGPAGAPEAP